MQASYQMPDAQDSCAHYKCVLLIDILTSSARRQTLRQILTSKVYPRTERFKYLQWL